MIIKFQNDTGYETIINIDRMLFCKILHAQNYYTLIFQDKQELHFSMQEFGRFERALKNKEYEINSNKRNETEK